MEKKQSMKSCWALSYNQRCRAGDLSFFQGKREELRSLISVFEITLSEELFKFNIFLFNTDFKEQLAYKTGS